MCPDLKKQWHLSMQLVWAPKSKILWTLIIVLTKIPINLFVQHSFVERYYKTSGLLSINKQIYTECSLCQSWLPELIKLFLWWHVSEHFSPLMSCSEWQYLHYSTLFSSLALCCTSIECCIPGYLSAVINSNTTLYRSSMHLHYCCRTICNYFNYTFTLSCMWFISR